jgi:hypothetical protein
MISVLTYGAIPYDTRAEARAGTDSSEAFQDALDAMGDLDDGSRGTTLHIPTGYYRISNILYLKRAGELRGDGGSGRYGRSALVFDDGKYLVTETYDSSSDGGTSQSCRINALTFIGPATKTTTIEAGVWCRQPVAFSHCTFLEFKGAGLKLDGAIGGADVFNVNGSSVEYCWFENNETDGVFTGGGNANSITFLKCRSFTNGRHGFHDSSFLGNTYIDCETDGHTSGSPFYVDGATNRTILFNPYAELSQDPNYLGPLVLVIGGNLYGVGFDAGGPGRMHIRPDRMSPFPVVNTLGSVTVQTNIGKADTGRIAFGFSSSDAGEEYLLRYQTDTDAQRWDMQHTGTSRMAYELTHDGHTQGPGWMSYPSGYLLGPHRRIVTSATSCPTGASPRPSGNWMQGDRVYNATPGENDIDCWVCTAQGNPGTWTEVLL